MLLDRDPSQLSYYITSIIRTCSCSKPSAGSKGCIRVRCKHLKSWSSQYELKVWRSSIDRHGTEENWQPTRVIQIRRTLDEDISLMIQHNKRSLSAAFSLNISAPYARSFCNRTRVFLDYFRGKIPQWVVSTGLNCIAPRYYPWPFAATR